MPPSAQRKTELPNPVLPGFYPDPSLCRVGEHYYLANSTFEYLPGIPIHESTDLRTWRSLGAAITRPEKFDLGNARDSGGIYAPTIRYHDGRFYVVGSQVDHRPETQFIISAADPAGPWTSPIWVADADGFDPSVFFHDGTAYWCAARILDPGQYEGQTAIWVREIDMATGLFTGPETVVWGGALRGDTWSEGPHIFEREGWFYLLTAEGGTYRDHAVMIARSRSVTGPYENCPRNPIISHRHLGDRHPVQNVGHADFVQRTDGSWAAALLGVRTENGRHILGRETFVADVVWEHGWPVVNPGVGMLTAVGERTCAWELEPARVAGALSVRGDARFAAETTTGVVLSASANRGRPSALFYRLAHHRAQLLVTFDAVEPGAAVGLALRQSDSYSIRLEIDGRRVGIIERAADVDIERDHWTLSDDAPLEIVAETTASSVCFRVGERCSSAVDASVLSSETAGGFVGTVWGPYVAGAAGAQARLRRIAYSDREMSEQL
ncbi:glycoside hydrolase family 43 protein [Rathayibacter soli]|uniref:glycoside hydrolase family 43 protein n=1 Tax=Rathayibacter soli TaxID=3144168 RepID=UPI0027E52ECF|nr:family 43 glycosylhydrolase [Glaciibacter superstes]